MSPYSGIPENLTDKMERCVADVMQKQGYEKSRAIAICHSSIMGGVMLEPVTAEDITQYSNHALLADYKPAELMKFKNAVFCRAGVNRNGDAIDKQGIKELRDTLSFMAIDDEHIPQKVVGFFVNPRDTDNSSTLMTDGIIYAGRFPEIAKQVES